MIDSLSSKENAHYLAVKQRGKLYSKHLGQIFLDPFDASKVLQTLIGKGILEYNQNGRFYKVI